MVIKGESVRLHIKTKTGIDDLNRPVYDDEVETVKNVLVGSPTSDEVLSEFNLSGKRIAYVLGIPKDDAHDWIDTIVEIKGHTFKTIGFPLECTEANIPKDIPWHKQVRVVAYE